MLYNKGNHAKLKCVQPQPSPLQGENGGKNHQTWNFGFLYPTREATKDMRPILQILMVILGLLIVSCTSFNRITPSPTPTGLLSEREAIDAAMSLAISNQPEINATQVKPTNINAKQSTLNKAFQEILSNSELPPGYSPTAPVWIITMEGQWREGFPFPTGASTPEPYHHFYVILDAKSGTEISLGTFR
jgi:hypothetical protein